MREQSETIVWADVAKVACVCLIVLMHGEVQIANAGWEDQSRITAIWYAINEFLRPIRLPTFFLISGLLTAKYVLQQADDTDRKCFVRPIYLYAVWAVILALLVPDYPATGQGGISLAERIEKIAFMGSPAWYLYGLAIFYLIAKVTRGLPIGPVLVGCAVLSVLGSIYLHNDMTYAAKLPRCLIFFIAGVRLKGAILAFADTASARRNTVLFAAFAVSVPVCMKLDTYLLPVDIIAVAFSVTTWSLVSRKLGALAGPIRWMGRRTLLIYVLHFPLICLLSALTLQWIDPLVRNEDFWLGLLHPIAAMLIVVPASLAIGTWLQDRGLGLLFDLPAGSRAPLPALRREEVPAG